MESKVFVQSFGSIFFSLIEIKYLPFLMLSIVVAPNTYCLSFLVFSTFDVKNFLIGPIDELTVFILEDLEPS